MLDLENRVNGDLLPRGNEERKGTILTPEGRELVGRFEELMKPEIDKLIESGSSTYDAESLLIRKMAKGVDVAKSKMKNYRLSNIFIAMGIATVMQPKNPDPEFYLSYEVRTEKSGKGKSSNQYDVLNIRETKLEGMNIPAPQLDRLLMRTAREKISITPFIPQYNHERPTVIVNNDDQIASTVDLLVELSSRVDLIKLNELVYGVDNHDVEWMVRLLKDIAEVKVGTLSRDFLITKLNSSVKKPARTKSW